MPLSKDDIKDLRTEREMSQQEFADAIGITRELLNKIESGKRIISRATELLINDFLRNEITTAGEKTQADRLGSLIEYLKTNIQEFASALGLQSTTEIDDIIIGNEQIPDHLINKISKAYRDVNINWLLTGQGHVFKKSEMISHETILNEPKETYLQQRRKLKQAHNGPFMVPLVPVKAQAGYVRSYDQETYVDTLEKYALPPGVNPQGAIWRYWEIEGDSMEPAFHSGDIILTSQVHQFDWENLRNFYLYVIVTSEKVLFKRIYCKNAYEWVLISENEDMYEQQLLPAEAVREVWVYRRSIVSKAPPTKMFEIKV